MGNTPATEPVKADGIKTEIVVPIARAPYMVQPTSFAEALQLAKVIAESSFCPKDFRGKTGDVFVAVQMGAEVGLRPLQALQSIAVINGRPSIYGDAAMALVRATGELADFNEYFEGQGDELTAFCLTLRRGDLRPVVRHFSSRWRRRRSSGGRPGRGPSTPPACSRCAPGRDPSGRLADALKGLFIREEVEDYDVETTGTPVTQQIAQATQARQEELKEKYAAEPAKDTLELTAPTAEDLAALDAKDAAEGKAREPGGTMPNVALSMLVIVMGASIASYGYEHSPLLFIMGLAQAVLGGLRLWRHRLR